MSTESDLQTRLHVLLQDVAARSVHGAPSVRRVMASLLSDERPSSADLVRTLLVIADAQGVDRLCADQDRLRQGRLQASVVRLTSLLGVSAAPLVDRHGVHLFFPPEWS